MKRNTKYGITILFLVLAIGFAALTTTLIINGTINVISADIDGLVYFSKATAETGGTATIIEPSKKSISYTTKNLTVIGDQAELTYYVYNDSDFDVDVTMSISSNSMDYFEEYTEFEYTGFLPSSGNDNVVRIPAKKTRLGKIKITVKKSIIDTGDLSFLVTLSSSVAAKEESSGDGEICNHLYDGEVAYFNPTQSGVNSTCDASTFDYDSISSCYRWRVISNCNGMLTLQLDHNLFVSTWINYDDELEAIDGRLEDGSYGNALGPITIFKQLEEATSTWTRVDPVSFDYSNTVDIATGVHEEYTDDPEINYGILSCVGGTCSVSFNPTYTFTNNLRARLITYEEVKALYGANNPTLAVKGKSTQVHENFLIISRNSSVNPQYNVGKDLWWLFENTIGADCYSISNQATGATLDRYAPKKDNRECVGVASYWTMSPGIKEPGLVGEDQIGSTGYALVLTAINADDDDTVEGGRAKFGFLTRRTGVRPVIEVPASMVSFENNSLN